MTPLGRKIAEMLEPSLLMEMVKPYDRALTAEEVAAIENGREAIARRVAEQIVTTVRNALDERAVEEMSRAHDDEEGLQKGDPSLWAMYDRGDFDGTPAHWREYRGERMTAMRCALRAVGLA